MEGPGADDAGLLGTEGGRWDMWGEGRAMRCLAPPPTQLRLGADVE